MLGKSESTLFLMKIQNTSVRNLSFVHFILPQIHLHTRHDFYVGFSKRLKLKDDAVPTILDPMWHHTSVSNCFYYVITIALSLLTDRLICIELFMCF